MPAGPAPARLRRLVVEADGGSRGNPGVAGYGALVRDAESGTVLVERAAPLGHATNNVAEYRGLIAGLEDNLRWIRAELGPKQAISLMAQYYATNKAATDPRHILLSRKISEREWFEAVSLLDELGIEEGFMQEYEGTSHYYRPDFTDPEKPFRDIRDFQ